MHLANVFNVANQITDLAGLERVAGFALRHELADFQYFKGEAGLEETNLLSARDFAVHQPDVGNRTAKNVVMRIEYHRLQHGFGVARRTGDALDDRMQKVENSLARLTATTQHLKRINSERLLHFTDHIVGPSVDHIDLVQGRHDR